MADRHHVTNYGELDMQDAESIRAYIRWYMAHNQAPTAAMLTRIEMLDEMAGKLDEKLGAKRASLYSIKPDEPIEDAEARLVRARTAEREAGK